jgi:hypothetical protein
MVRHSYLILFPGQCYFQKKEKRPVRADAHDQFVLTPVHGRITFLGMTTITCKIPDDLNARLEAEAGRKLLPKSAVVREALERSLKQPKASRRQTAFDLVKNLCGIVKGGPGDMSTNPKYMKDFGA